MKKLFMFMAALAMAQMAAAIPAKRVVRSVAQPDGTTVEVVLRGDETFHFYTTPDGTPVRRGADGYWVRDTRDVKALWKQRAQRRAQQRQPHAQKMRRMLTDMSRQTAKRRATRAADNDIQEEQINKKGLLILVNFKDKKLSTPTAQINTVYDQILNSTGNPYGDNHGSVHEYFRDQSYGQLNVTFDIKGPVTLANNMQYYGQDVDASGRPSTAADDEGNDAHPGEMVKEALKAIQSEVNFADYDWDGDGEVENVYVIYAGYGQASGAPANTIWPHQWQLSEATGSAFRYQGITIDTYACGSELMDVSGSVLDGIGTMCHEYSHCLGLPDFYDTEGMNFGMCTWSIMDYGCYNDDGFCPAGYTAYERMYSGWLEPTELNTATNVAGLKPIEDNAEAYIIYNDANHDEYYLLENHQQTGWDEAAYGHGMLVVHVDYDQTAWYNNTVNNTASRQRMTIIPADNARTVLSSSSWTAYNASLQGLAGDPFPGTGGTTELTDSSTPAATLYRNNTDGKKFMHKPVTNIEENADGTISFVFMGGAAPTVATPATDDARTDIHSNRFTAAWTAVEGAASYNLQYRTVETDGGADDLVTAMQQAVRLSEDFQNFVKATSGDVSNKLDELMNASGWTGTKVFTGLNGAKLGSANYGGSLTSPAFSCASGHVSLMLGLGTYGTDDAQVDVSILSADGNVVSTQTMAPDDEYYITLAFDNVPANARLYIGTNGGKQRCYVDFCLAFDGDYSSEDISSYYDAIYGGDEEDYDDLWSASRKARRKGVAATRHNATSYGQWQTVAGITGTSHFLSDLKLNARYQWRVQAVDADGNTSAWSAPMLVQLAGTVGISDMPNGSMATTNRQTGTCYSLGGQRLNTAPKRGVFIIDGKKAIR